MILATVSMSVPPALRSSRVIPSRSPYGETRRALCGNLGRNIRKDCREHASKWVYAQGMSFFRLNWKEHEWLELAVLLFVALRVLRDESRAVFIWCQFVSIRGRIKTVLCLPVLGLFEV